MTLFLGKKPARDGAFPHKFGAIFSAADLPTVPLILGRVEVIHRLGLEWGMLGNDQAGNCVEVSAPHQVMQWHALAGTPIPTFTAETSLADYSAVTGYVPDSQGTDNGTDMGAFATYWKSTGIADITGARHKIDLSVNISPGNLAQVALSIFMFGSADIGLQLPSSAMDQFASGQPWVPIAGSVREGGHDVPLIGRNSAGYYIGVTWGRLQAIHPSFLTTYMDEGGGHISVEMLNAKHLSPRGYDQAALTAAAARV